MVFQDLAFDDACGFELEKELALYIYMVLCEFELENDFASDVFLRGEHRRCNVAFQEATLI